MSMLTKETVINYLKKMVEIKKFTKDDYIRFINMLPKLGVESTFSRARDYEAVTKGSSYETKTFINTEPEPVLVMEKDSLQMTL